MATPLVATFLVMKTRGAQGVQSSGGALCVAQCVGASAVLAPRAPWTGSLLVLRRNLEQPDEVKFYFSNAPETIPLQDLVRLSGMRWPVEMIFEEGKGEIGFDHYETRS